MIQQDAFEAESQAMQPQPFLIAVADGSIARFLELPGPGKAIRPSAIASLVQEHDPSRSIASDRPGRSFESATPTRHAVEPKSDPHDFEKSRFAAEVGRTLNEALRADRRLRLVLVAAPVFLGRLRKAIAPQLRPRIHAELAKDLVHETNARLPRHLSEVLPVG